LNTVFSYPISPIGSVWNVSCHLDLNTTSDYTISSLTSNIFQGSDFTAKDPFLSSSFTSTPGRNKLYHNSLNSIVTISSAGKIGLGISAITTPSSGTDSVANCEYWVTFTRLA